MDRMSMCNANFIVTEAPAMVGNLLELFPTFSKGSLYTIIDACVLNRYTCWVIAWS